MNNRKHILSLLNNLVLLAVVGAVMWVLISATRQNPPNDAVATASNLSVDVTSPEAPMATEMASYPGPLTPPPVFTPAPTWDVNFHPTMPPATPKPITYSIDSAEEWMTYANSELGISLKYPENPPQVVDRSEHGYNWKTLYLTIRTGPTLPASTSNIAEIIIAIHPNPNRLRLSEASKHITVYGNLSLLDRHDDSVLYSLGATGADEAAIVNSDWGPLYVATRGEYVYILGGGATTEGEAQYKILKLVVSTLKFSASK